MIPVSPNIVCPSHHTHTIRLVAKCLPSRNSCTPPHMSCQLSCLQLNISSFLSSPRQRSRSKAWSVLGKTSNPLISCMLNFSWPSWKKEKESRRARSCKMHTYIYLTLAQRKLRSGIPSAFSSGIWALFSSLFQTLLLRCGSYPLVHLQSEESSSLASPCFLSQTTQPTGYGWVADKIKNDILTTSLSTFPGQPFGLLHGLSMNIMHTSMYFINCRCRWISETKILIRTLLNHEIP